MDLGYLIKYITLLFFLNFKNRSENICEEYSTHYECSFHKKFNKAKSHPITWLCRHRREAELYLQPTATRR